MSPRYEFRCPNCQVVIEQTRALDEDRPMPICGDCLVSFERVYSSPSVHFKGEGWGSSK